MMSWVERLCTLGLITNAGVAKCGPAGVDDGRGVEAAKRGVAWNRGGPAPCCWLGVWRCDDWVLCLLEARNLEAAGVCGFLSVI